MLESHNLGSHKETAGVLVYSLALLFFHLGFVSDNCNGIVLIA